MFQIAAKQTFCTSWVGNIACHSIWLLCDPAWIYLVLYGFQNGRKIMTQTKENTTHGNLQWWRIKLFNLNNSVIMIICWLCFWWSFWEKKDEGQAQNCTGYIQSLRRKRQDIENECPVPRQGSSWDSCTMRIPPLSISCTRHSTLEKINTRWVKERMALYYGGKRSHLSKEK